MLFPSNLCMSISNIFFYLFIPVFSWRYGFHLYHGVIFHLFDFFESQLYDSVINCDNSYLYYYCDSLGYGICNKLNLYFFLLITELIVVSTNKLHCKKQLKLQLQIKKSLKKDTTDPRYSIMTIKKLITVMLIKQSVFA